LFTGKRYGVVDDLDLSKGTVIGHRDGFGFFWLEQGGPLVYPEF
jgi:ribonuclease R